MRWYPAGDVYQARVSVHLSSSIVGGHRGSRYFAVHTVLVRLEDDSPDNLLKPYRVPMEGGRAKQRWEIPTLNLAFTVALAGGSHTDCESWFIVLEPLDTTSH